MRFCVGYRTHLCEFRSLIVARPCDIVSFGKHVMIKVTSGQILFSFSIITSSLFVTYVTQPVHFGTLQTAVTDRRTRELGSRSSSETVAVSMKEGGNQLIWWMLSNRIEQTKP
jgi:hypothetical protein